MPSSLISRTESNPRSSQAGRRHYVPGHPPRYPELVISGPRGVSLRTLRRAHAVVPRGVELSITVPSTKSPATSRAHIFTRRGLPLEVLRINLRGPMTI